LAAASTARVVQVRSVGHINGDVDQSDLNFERQPYNPWLAHSQSKTANVLFAVEAARRWMADHIAVNALNPGRMASTGLGLHQAPPPATYDPT
jgi:NAD(P)-dependent dehydrogenase (short-subunit alcohol dehydrogenase family)